MFNTYLQPVHMYITNLDPSLWEINKLYLIYLYGILVINTQPWVCLGLMRYNQYLYPRTSMVFLFLHETEVHTRISYKWMEYNLFISYKDSSRLANLCMYICTGCKQVLNMCHCYIKYINFKVSRQGDIIVMNWLITIISPWQPLIKISHILGPTKH